MKETIFIICLGMLVACAAPSTITFKNGKVETASNYSISNKDGAYVPNIPDNWFTSAMKQIFDSIGPFLGPFVEFFGGKAVVPSITPTPTPVPTPAPAPVPVRPYP
jgi:hypothetical protein